MKDVYRVRVRRPKRRRACALLLAGALLIYGASFLGRVSSAPRVRSEASRAGVRVTREEELAAIAFYPVVLAETTDPLQARIEAARYTPRGAAGYVWKSGSLYRAVAALYAQEDDAVRASENLLRAAGISCTAAEMRAPGVLLRVMAAKEQASALLAADEALPAAVRRLGKIAQDIDDGETDAAQALTALSTEAARLEEARALLEQAFADGAGIPRGLAALLKDAAAEIQALSQEEGLARLTLSGRTRCLQAGLAERFCAYRSGLAG